MSRDSRSLPQLRHRQRRVERRVQLTKVDRLPQAAEVASAAAETVTGAAVRRRRGVRLHGLHPRPTRRRFRRAQHSACNPRSREATSELLQTLPPKMARTALARILIVEDDGDLLEVLKFVLEDAGNAVEVSSDGMDASRVVQAAAIDLVVLDLTLNETSGLAVARELRADAKTAHVLIAIHTGRAEASVRAEFADYDLFMPKGDDAEQLVRLVSEVLATRPTVAAAEQKQSVT
jgi:CheY-like chemotaxis protein